MDQDYFMDAFVNQLSHFDSSLSSMVTGPPAANDAFFIRELIMKLGGRGGTAATLFSGGASDSTNFTPPLADPAFAERAARLSCYGSRSFNGRTANNIESARERFPTPLMGNVKLSRVCSSPSLTQAGSTPENKDFTKIQTKMSKTQGLADNSNEESSISDQRPSSNELSLRKRKAKSQRGDDANAKRLKASESVKNETRADEEEEEANEKQRTNQKPPEPPKDYIHVRARRGQATDSHSLAERVRREKISERMKLLQDLVPGCNKVTGKALMLDEIINYVQSLQRQVEFLSMKLATVNPGLDFDMENIVSISKEIPQQMYPLNSSFFHHQDVQQLHETRGPSSRCSMAMVAPLQLESNLGIDQFYHQLPAFDEDDLHSIVQMGLSAFPCNDSSPRFTSNADCKLPNFTEPCLVFQQLQITVRA